MWDKLRPHLVELHLVLLDQRKPVALEERGAAVHGVGCKEGRACLCVQCSMCSLFVCLGSRCGAPCAAIHGVGCGGLFLFILVSTTCVMHATITLQPPPSPPHARARPAPAPLTVAGVQLGGLLLVDGGIPCLLQLRRQKLLQTCGASRWQVGTRGASRGLGGWLRVGGGRMGRTAV